MELAENRIFLSCAKPVVGARLSAINATMINNFAAMVFIGSAGRDPNRAPRHRQFPRVVSWASLTVRSRRRTPESSCPPCAKCHATSAAGQLDNIGPLNLDRANPGAERSIHMFAKIRHVAAHTEHYDKVAKFYQTVFGMKQITTGLVDETGQHNPNRGHISDGVIGMALLAKRPGNQQGLDHFGFEVDDVQEAV